MARVERTTTEIMGVLAHGLPALSTSARHFLRDRPREARLADAAALEAAAAQFDAEAAPEEAPQPLAPFVVRRHGNSDMLGVTAAAARLGVSRTTVYDWIGKGTLLGWKSTRRGLTVPGSQILRTTQGRRRSCGGPRCDRRSRVRLGVPHAGMAVRGRGGRAARDAEGRPDRGGDRRRARVRRDLLVSRSVYPEDRIRTALLGAALPACFRIVPRRHLASPLGIVPADSMSSTYPHLPCAPRCPQADGRPRCG